MELKIYLWVEANGNLKVSLKFGQDEVCIDVSYFVLPGKSFI